MTRSQAFFIITAFVGLVANLLAIAGYFGDQGPLASWQLDPGLLIAATFVVMAYGLAVWSALVWHWTGASDPDADTPHARGARFLLNALAAFPCLAGWLYLLATTKAQTDLSSVDRWLLSLALAWVATPFAALGLTSLGEILAPLLRRRS